MSAQQFVVATTGVNVTLNDLGGRVLTHPSGSVDLLVDFSRDELFRSADLQAAIDAEISVAGTGVTAVDQDGNTITDVKDFLWASSILYDNTGSGLTATTVQAALDEVAGATVTETYACQFNRDKINTKDLWLDQAGGPPCNLSPFVVPYAGNLIKIVAASQNADTYDAEVYKNADVRSGGTPTDGNKIAELVVAAADSAVSGDLSVAVAAGDEIGLFLRSAAGADYPNVTLLFSR
jgi:hypothetical protein